MCSQLGAIFQDLVLIMTMALFPPKFVEVSVGLLDVILFAEEVSEYALVCHVGHRVWSYYHKEAGVLLRVLAGPPQQCHWIFDDS